MQEPQETWVRSLGQEDSPGGGNGNPLKFLAWRITQIEEPGGLQPMGSQKVRHTSQLVNLSDTGQQLYFK